jgi:hypothetical protein
VQFIGIVLLVLGLLTAAGLWLVGRWGTPHAVVLFSSDDPPPPGTIEFNTSIVTACGEKTTAEFKLALLTRSEPITRSIALQLAREKIEQGAV